MFYFSYTAFYSFEAVMLLRKDFRQFWHDLQIYLWLDLEMQKLPQAISQF